MRKSLTPHHPIPTLASLHAGFLSILPRVQLHATIFFRHLRCPHSREDAVAETVALAWAWYRRLVEKGQDPTLFVTTLATYADNLGKRVAGGRANFNVLGWEVATLDAMYAAVDAHLILGRDGCGFEKRGGGDDLEQTGRGQARGFACLAHPQAQGFFVLVTYGVGMLIGAQIAGRVYGRFLGGATGASDMTAELAVECGEGRGSGWAGPAP